MDIGKVVSTVQSEPLTLEEFEEVLNELDLDIFELPSLAPTKEEVFA